MEKLWIVGLHRAITQPTAIRRIHALPNCHVKVFVGGRRLNLEALLRGQRFHAKVLAFDSGSANRLSCLMTSSANLTEAAFGSHPHNYEAGISITCEQFPPSVVRSFNGWWQTVWDTCTDFSYDLLDRYIKIRDEYLERNPDAFADQDRPSVHQIEDARCLWIEAGAMSGGPRHQVEFSEELARFFGPIVRNRRLFRVAVGMTVRDDRPLSYKVTTLHVEIWRFSLITRDQGGPVYAGRVIHFAKDQDAHGELLRVDVADLNSQEHRQWRRQANRYGHLGATSGNRSYGFY
jgi:hypothetical protein